MKELKIGDIVYKTPDSWGDTKILYSKNECLELVNELKCFCGSEYGTISIDELTELDIIDGSDYGCKLLLSEGENLYLINGQVL